MMQFGRRARQSRPTINLPNDCDGGQKETRHATSPAHSLKSSRSLLLQLLNRH